MQILTCKDYVPTKPIPKIRNAYMCSFWRKGICVPHSPPRLRKLEKKTQSFATSRCRYQILLFPDMIGRVFVTNGRLLNYLMK